MTSLNDELDDRFVEVEIETSEVNRLRDIFEENEKTISGLEENRQKIQNEYDLLKAEDDELDDKLKSQLKFIGKEIYKPIKMRFMNMIVYRQKSRYGSWSQALGNNQ